MSASDDWIRSLPDDARSPEHSSAVLAGVEADVLGCAWVPVSNTAGGRTATFYVSDDAVRALLTADFERDGYKLSAGSRFRPQMSARLLQDVADAMGAMLPTALVCDLAYEQAQVVFDSETEPTATEEERARMSLLEDSVEWNAKVERDRSGRGDGAAPVLVRDVGKTWLASNLLAKRAAGRIAVNYGLFSKHAPGRSVRGHAIWQGVGTMHNDAQFDYSQVGILMLASCSLDGVVVETARLLDGTYGLDAARLGSHEGPIGARWLRQPRAST